MKLSRKQKLNLLALVSSCEYFQLNEKQVLEFINGFFHKRPISRRTYYNYKKQVYEIDYGNINNLEKIIKNLQDAKAKKPYEDMKLKQEYRNISIDAWVYAKYGDNRLKRIQECVNTISNKLGTIISTQNSEYKKSIAYFKSIPQYATIRTESVNCGNQCRGCPHGPYYYGYWKDRHTGKLKKKYLGTTDVRQNMTK